MRLIMNRVKINNRKFKVESIPVGLFETLERAGYHVTDWQYFNAKRLVTDLTTGKFWLAPAHYRKFIEEAMISCPKDFS